MPPECQPDEDEYPVVWVRVFLGGHADHGGWWRDRGEAVCACGETLPAERQAAA